MYALKAAYPRLSFRMQRSVYVWRGHASGRGGAEAHSGPMTHPFAGFCQQGGGHPTT